MEYLKRWVIELFLLYIFSDGSVATVTQWRHQYKMWSESYANGCLSGWNFLPGTQETGKSNWHCWTDKVAKTSRKTKKQFRPIEKIWEEAGQDMALNFFFLVFPWFWSSFFPLSEFGLFVWEFGIDPSSRNGSRSADRMILSRQCKTCAFV